MFEPQTDDPISQFDRWFADAQASEINDPNAMTVATADADGRPSARILLLKGYDADGLFLHQLDSRKGGELRANPFVSLCFHWKSLPARCASKARWRRSMTPRPTPISPAARQPDWAWASRQPIADRAARAIGGRGRGPFRRRQCRAHPIGRGCA